MKKSHKKEEKHSKKKPMMDMHEAKEMKGKDSKMKMPMKKACGRSR